MKHWIFDFDGTLVDTDGIFNKALVHALEPFNVDIGTDFMEKIRHKHPHRIFEDYLTDEQADRAMERMREIAADLNANVKAFPGIVNVLNTLEKHKATLSIWTGRDRESTLRILKKTGLDGFFEKIISGTCVPTNKPGKDGLFEIRDHHSAEYTEMVMTGDHHHDIEPANELGILSIYAGWKRQPHILPKQVEPKKSFGSTDLFHEWVQVQLRSKS